MSKTKSILPMLDGKNCPVCGSKNLIDFLKIGKVPVHVGKLWSTSDQAQAAPSGNILLSFCQNCKFIHNRTFNPESVNYEPGYEISLHHSPMYQAFLHDMALRIIKNYNLRDKTIVEIGCGTGYFLSMLCQLGNNVGYGFDPSVGNEVIDEIEDTTIKIIRDLYSEKYTQLEVDFICCRHVLQHIAHPVNFLRTLRHTISNRKKVFVYFELPNASYVFQNQYFWTVFYEHCSYFTPEALAWLFRVTGFDVLKVMPCYEGNQYMYIDATLEKPSRIIAIQPSTELMEMPEELKAFSLRYKQHIEELKVRLDKMAQTGRRIIAWGSGGRGISFLNALKTKNQINYVVDINPNRQGRYIPISGQQVVAPEYIAEYRPDLVIITNPTYEQEIREKVESFGLSCEYLVV